MNDTVAYKVGTNGHSKNGNGKHEPVEVPVPTDHLAEEACVGSLILDRDAVIKIAHFLRPEDFQQERLGKAYEAILSLYEQRTPTDFVTLCGELDRMGVLSEVGGYAYLAAVANRTPTAVHVEYYARSVVDCALRRGLISCGGNIAGLAYDRRMALEELMERAQEALQSVNLRAGREDFVHIDAALTEFLDRLEVLQQQEGKGLGVQSGYGSLDRITGGFQPSDLIVVGARPGVGKTALALNIARNAAKEGRAIGIFSLEMSRAQLTQRLVAIEAHVDSQKLRLGRTLTEDEQGRVADAAGALSELAIHIDDTSHMGIGELRTRALRMKADKDIDLLIVDYLQLVKGPPSKEANRPQEIDAISRGLKLVAKELGVPLFVCAQVNRESEDRSGGVPQLRDFADGSGIEKHADIAIMLHPDKDFEHRVKLHFQKNRHGAQGLVVPLQFDPQTTSFAEVMYVYQQGATNV